MTGGGILGFDVLGDLRLRRLRAERMGRERLGGGLVVGFSAGLFSVSTSCLFSASSFCGLALPRRGAGDFFLFLEGGRSAGAPFDLPRRIGLASSWVRVAISFLLSLSFCSLVPFFSWISVSISWNRRHIFFRSVTVIHPTFPTLLLFFSCRKRISNCKSRQKSSLLPLEFSEASWISRTISICHFSGSGSLSGHNSAGTQVLMLSEGRFQLAMISAFISDGMAAGFCSSPLGLARMRVLAGATSGGSGLRRVGLRGILDTFLPRFNRGLLMVEVCYW